MRLPADGLKARFVRIAGVSTLTLALCACGSSGSADYLPLSAAQPLGPQADYPVVVGDPYNVAGTTYTPVDVMNYDAVGYIAADTAENGVSGSHHTLPLPSYVEITSLETGRTILVRLERRGPMDSEDVVGLSAGALTQIEARPGTPVRIRRVNPPEDQRALLRAGMSAAPRMDTPMSLVEILRRKLPGTTPQPALASSPSAEPPTLAAVVPAAPTPVRDGPPALPPLDTSATANARVAAPARPALAADGDFIVQAAAFSTSDRAENAANVLGGEVSRSGQFFRVRTGPFATRGEAEASLAKVRAAGYRDARILTSG